MFTALCIYYLIIGIIELFNSSISKKIMAGISLLPAFILTAFRDISVGSDTIAYYRAFNRISVANAFSDLLNSERMESGYIAVNYIFSHLGFSFFQMQFVVSLFIYIALYVLLSKYSKNIGWSCFLFLTLRYLFGPMNVVRMYVATAFLYFSIPFLQRRNFILFLVFVLTATMFHKTALIFVILYPLTKIKISKKSISIVFISAGIISFLGKNFFMFLTEKMGMYESYLSGKYFNYEENIAVYLILAIDICLALLVFFNEKNNNQIVELNKKIVPIEKICNSSIIVLLCCDIVGLNNTIMGRISGYFSFSWLILVPLVVMKIKNKATAILVFVLVSLCLFVQYETVMIYRPTWNNVEPYNFYFGDLF